MQLVSVVNPHGCCYELVSHNYEVFILVFRYSTFSSILFVSGTYIVIVRNELAVFGYIAAQ